jgi:Na+-translocating ferredoxin:NAD+ oxidoreductase RnfG subunit
MKRILFLLSLCFLTNISFASLSQKLEQRMDKSLKKHLGTSDFSHDEILISSGKEKELSFELRTGQLFNLTQTKQHTGYIFIDEGRGRHEVFTFMIVLNPKLEIEFVYVLEYNEVYGMEISGKKWLKKFKGFNPKTKIIFNKTIDAISGATISSKSIIEGISLVLQKMDELNNKGCLKN